MFLKIFCFKKIIPVHTEFKVPQYTYLLKMHNVWNMLHKARTWILIKMCKYCFYIIYGRVILILQIQYIYSVSYLTSGTL